MEGVQKNTGAVRRDLFVGRRALLDEFGRCASRQTRGESEVWAIIGDRGQGKSSVRTYIATSPPDGTAIVDFEWTKDFALESRPLPRHLYSSIRILPWWEQWLDISRRMLESVGGNVAGPVPVPRARFKPHDGHQFATRVRSRLRGSVQTLAILVDEIGIDEHAADRSLNFARELANAGGADSDINVLLLLFIVRQQASEFLNRPSAPRSVRRFELEDFDTADIHDLLSNGFCGQERTFEEDLAHRIRGLTGGRPDLTMGLLVDAWDSMVDARRLCWEHVRAAAEDGPETRARLHGVLKEDHVGR